MILALSGRASAPMPAGHPGLAHLLAWVGLVLVIGGFITMYLRDDGSTERLGFTIACTGALACVVALAVAP